MNSRCWRKAAKTISFSSDVSDYAANIELAEAIAPQTPRAAATQEMTLVDTPNAKTIAELVEQFNLPIEKNGKNAAGESGERQQVSAGGSAGSRRS